MSNPFSHIFDKKKTPKKTSELKKSASTPPTKKVEGDTWTKRAVKPTVNRNSDDSTQRYLPFSEIRDNIIIMKDGSARSVLRVQAINFLLKSEAEQDSIIYSFQHFLNALEFPIQILIRSLKVDIEGYLNRLKNITSGQKNQLLRDQSERYIEFLTNLVNVAQIMKKEFYIIIPHDEKKNESVNPKGMVQIVKSFFSGVSQTVTLDQIRQNLARIEYLRKSCQEKANTVKSSLEFVGLKSEIMSKEELVELLISYYDPKVNSVAKGLGKEAHYDLVG